MSQTSSAPENTQREESEWAGARHRIVPSELCSDLVVVWEMPGSLAPRLEEEFSDRRHYFDRDGHWECCSRETFAVARHPGAMPDVTGTVVWACERMAFLEEGNVKSRINNGKVRRAEGEEIFRGTWLLHFAGTKTSA